MYNIVAIDIGRHSIKVKGNLGCFRVINSVNNDDSSCNYSNWGDKVTVGSGDRYCKQVGDKYDMRVIAYSILSACSDGDEVDVVVGINMGEFLSVGDGIEKGILGISGDTYIINGVIKTVVINKVTTYMNGASSLLVDKEIMMLGGSADILVVDIGYDKIELCKFTCGVPDIDGVSILNESLRDIVGKNDTGGVKGLKKLIENDKFSRDIYKYFKCIQIKIHEIGGKSLDGIKFTGGGSILLRDTINMRIGRSITSNNMLYDNVYGLYCVGKIV